MSNNIYAALGDSSDDEHTTTSPIPVKAVKKTVTVSKGIKKPTKSTVTGSSGPSVSRDTRRVDRSVKPRSKGNAGGKKRDFDRKSGTGRGKEGKKDGAGNHNWGKATEEVEDVNAEEASEEEEEVEPKEPEVELIGLDEYLSKRVVTRTNAEAFADKSVRSIEVSEDLETVKAANIDDEISGYDNLISRKAVSKKNKKQANKVTGDFDAALLFKPAPISNDRPYNRYENKDNDNRRGGGRGRGRGRGGNRSNNGRGRRNNKSTKSTLVANDKNFPALGAF